MLSILSLSRTHTPTHSQSLTILQSGHSLRLFADDTVSNVVGCQHAKLVRGEGFEPVEKQQPGFCYFKVVLMPGTMWRRKKKKIFGHACICDIVHH